MIKKRVKEMSESDQNSYLEEQKKKDITCQSDLCSD